MDPLSTPNYLIIAAQDLRARSEDLLQRQHELHARGHMTVEDAELLLTTQAAQARHVASALLMLATQLQAQEEAPQESLRGLLRARALRWLKGPRGLP